jgi:D-proline reductase (dithiol) PrdB
MHPDPRCAMPPVMDPIAYVAELNKFYRSQGFPAYKWTVNDTTPLTPLTRSLRECRIAMLTSGGVSRKVDPPFNPQARNDLRVDAIANDTAADFFVIRDDYYNHADAERDINCIFPIERLRELAADHVIGRIAPHHYSGFMGRTYNRSAVINEAAPALARRLHDEKVDALVMVPGCPLDHQTVGLVARVVEESGIPTVVVATGRDITAQVRPPRSVFVNFPMGNPFGKPFDKVQQRAILLDALGALESIKRGGEMIDLPYQWEASFEIYLGSRDRAAMA